MSKFQFSDPALSLIGEVAAFIVVVAVVVILAMLKVRSKKAESRVVVETSQATQNVVVETSLTGGAANSEFDPQAFVCEQVAHMLAEDRRNIAEDRQPSLGALTFPPTGYHHRFGYSLLEVSISRMPPPGPNYELVTHHIDRNEGSPRRYYSVLYRMW